MKLLVFRQHYKQQGFLLLEYLVGLALFALLLLYLDAAFALHTRVKSSLQQQSNSITQLRQITLQLQPELKQAGFLGCHKQDKSIHIHKVKSNDWQPPLPDCLRGKVDANSDVLLIEQVGDWTVSLQKAMQSKTDVLLLPEITVENHIWYVIDDCYDHEFFQAYAYQCGNALCLQAVQALQKAYGTNAIVSPWQTRAYYLQDKQLITKILQSETPAITLQNHLATWRLILWPNILEVNFGLNNEEYALWFKY
jgi:Tfp pilus assembly protein PilW